jgi:hypothetical protein
VHWDVDRDPGSSCIGDGMDFSYFFLQKVVVASEELSGLIRSAMQHRDCSRGCRK